MEQLPLEIRLDDHAVFASFLPDGNEEVIHALESVAASPRPGMTWIWGQAGTGRTHLLQATVAAAEAGGHRGAFLPLDPALGLTPGTLAGFAEFAVVAVDDAMRAAGDPAWERALFRLYEELRRNGGALLAAGAAPPAMTGFRLADLASRLASGVTFRLRALDDVGRLAALQRRAAFRGLELPDDTGRWLLTHLPRDLPGLFRLLDELDRAQLVARKRLTIPFVKAVLGGQAG